MAFDPKYTRITQDPNSRYGYLLEDVRTGETKHVRGVTGQAHSVFNKVPSSRDTYSDSFGELARQRGISIHEQISSWIDTPNVFGSIDTAARRAIGSLVAQFPPSQGWVFKHDVPLSDFRRYASEADIIAENTNTGEVHIIDVKTGKWRGGEYTAQLSFYKQMYEQQHGKGTVHGLWGLTAKEVGSGIQPVQPFTAQQVNSIFYKGKQITKTINEDVRETKRAFHVPKREEILQHFNPAKKVVGRFISKPITVFDIETGPRDEPIQVSAMKFVHNLQTGKLEVVDTFNRYYTGDPTTYQTQAWATLQEVHGISPTVAKKRAKGKRWGPDEQGALSLFAKDTIIAGHNISEFDMPIVFKGMSTEALGDYAVLDTLHIARNVRGQGGNKLGQLFQLTTGKTLSEAGLSAHDSFYDVIANAKLIEEWYGRKGQIGERTRVIIDNPGLSTMIRNSYTGAEVLRMADGTELDPEELSKQFGTGMHFEDINRLDEEKAHSLEGTGLNANDGGFGGGWGSRLQLEALLEDLKHIGGTGADTASTIATAIHSLRDTQFNSTLSRMIHWADEDIVAHLKDMGFGDRAIMANDGAGLLRRVQRMRQSHWRGRLSNVLAMTPESLRGEEWYKTGEHHVKHSTATASAYQIARMARDEGLKHISAADKAQNLLRYAEYYEMSDDVQNALRNVTNTKEWFDARMLYKEERDDQRAIDRADERAYELELQGAPAHVLSAFENVGDKYDLIEANQLAKQEMAAIRKTQGWRDRGFARMDALQLEGMPEHVLSAYRDVTDQHTWNVAQYGAKQETKKRSYADQAGDLIQRALVHGLDQQTIEQLQMASDYAHLPTTSRKSAHGALWAAKDVYAKGQERKSFEDKKHHLYVEEMAKGGKHTHTAALIALAKDEDALTEARVRGAKAIEEYNKKFETSVSLVQNAAQFGVGIPGQIAHMDQHFRGVTMAGMNRIYGAMSGLVPPELLHPMQHFGTAVTDAWENRHVMRNAKMSIFSNTASNVLSGASSAAMMSGGNPWFTLAGGLLGGLKSIPEGVQLTGEAKINQTVSRMSETINIWNAGINLALAPVRLLANALKSLVKGIMGLGAAISGITVAGLNKMSGAQEHFASITGMSHGRYLDTYKHDYWLGTQEGSFANDMTTSIASVRTLLESGEGNPAWTALALTGGLGQYLQMDDATGYYSLLNDIAAQGFRGGQQEQNRIMSLVTSSGILGNTGAKMLQAMFTHGITDSRNVGSGARNGMVTRNRDEAWQYRINNTRTQWQTFQQQFDNSWMTIAMNAWDAFGRDVTNVIMEVMHAFEDGGLRGGITKLKEVLSELWEAFSSGEGIGGIDLGDVIEAGANLGKAIISGVGHALEAAAPLLGSAFASIWEVILNGARVVLDELSAVFHKMSSYQINWDGLRNIVAKLPAALAGNEDAQAAIANTPFLLSGRSIYDNGITTDVNTTTFKNAYDEPDGAGFSLLADNLAYKFGSGNVDKAEFEKTVKGMLSSGYDKRHKFIKTYAGKVDYDTWRRMIPTALDENTPAGRAKIDKWNTLIDQAWLYSIGAMGFGNWAAGESDLRYGTNVTSDITSAILSRERIDEAVRGAERFATESVAGAGRAMQRVVVEIKADDSTARLLNTGPNGKIGDVILDVGNAFRDGFDLMVQYNAAGGTN